MNKIIIILISLFSPELKLIFKSFHFALLYEIKPSWKHFVLIEDK